MSAASSITSRNHSENKVEPLSKAPPLYRSRTDSVILYTAPSIGEAAGSTFYIRKNGHIDYNVLLKVFKFFMLHFSTISHPIEFQALHKITLRENVCTARVCEVVLSLTSTLIDLGVLANNTKALLSSLVKSDDNATASASAASASATASEDKSTGGETAVRPPSANDTKDNDNKPGSSPNETTTEAAGTASEAVAEKVSSFSLHNTFMDIVIRQEFQSSLCLYETFCIIRATQNGHLGPRTVSLRTVTVDWILQRLSKYSIPIALHFPCR